MKLQLRRIAPLLALVALLMPAAPAAARKHHSHKARLTAFRSCDGLLGYARRHGAQQVATGWVPPARPVAQPAPTGVPQREGATNAPAAAPAEPDFSTTNVQEAGVDEPDIVKTNGKTIFAVANGTLYAVDARATPAKLLGSLKLADGAGHELFIHGDRLLVLQNAWLAVEPQPGPQPGPEPAQPAQAIAYPYPAGEPVTRMTEVDSSDPAAMKIVRTERVDGTFVSARLTGATARVVISSPAKALDVAVATPVAQGQRTTVVRSRRARRARLSQWRPYSFFRDRRRARSALKPIVACRHTRYPVQFSGSGTLTVLTVDMEKGLPAVDNDALMTDGDTVYGSAGSLYVATRRWLTPQAEQRPVPQSITTAIHRFDVSQRDSTEYRASGEVQGFLLSQWSLSEYRGVLRVASTVQPEWWSGPARPESESFVTVLDEHAGKFVQVGRVGGLGKGERIYAVRCIDDVGYVVTFRQVDPLYTIDLSNPAKPTVKGELKLSGYSAYLHPLAGDLLLGVGQDASDQGRLQGTKLSLFDVSDPAAVKVLAEHPLGSSSSSEAEYDHHAFLWWAPAKLAVLPVSKYSEQPNSQPFIGAFAFHVDRAGGITDAGRIEHPSQPYPVAIRRSLVIGSHLFTLSDAGVMSSDLGSLKQEAWVPFAA